MAEAKFLWLDCEFTSITDTDPTQDAIWEFASVVTDGDLQPLDSFETFVAHPVELAEAVSERQWWIDHPDDYARMVDALQTGRPPEEVDEALVEFTSRHFEPKQAMIAGNSIATDRRRIEFTFPRFHALLSHQSLDVTSIRKWGELRTGRRFERDESQRHKAMGDIELSIGELVFWHNVLVESDPFIP